MYRTSLWISLSILTACGASSGLHLAPPSAKSSQGDKLSEFSYQELTASDSVFKQIRFPTDETFTVLTVFTSDCEPCGKVINALNQLPQSSLGIPVKVMGLSLTQDGPQLRRFLQSHRPQMSIGIGERPLVRQDGLLSTVTAVPTTFLLDQNGQLIKSFFGSIHLAYVIKLIQRSASSQPHSSSTTSEHERRP